MRSLVKFVLLPALALACAFAGLWRAQGQRDRDNRSSLTSEAPKPSVSRSAGVMVRVNDDSFVLKNLKLERMAGSTVIKGAVVNKSNRYLDQATFEVKAYDREGKLLQGVEEKTIFTAHQLKAKASTQINSGYGVWLQGIPFDAIARVEISETSKQAVVSSALEIIPLASHAAAWKEDAEIEE